MVNANANAKSMDLALRCSHIYHHEVVTLANAESAIIMLMLVLTSASIRRFSFQSLPPWIQRPRTSDEICLVGVVARETDRKDVEGSRKVIRWCVCVCACVLNSHCTRFPCGQLDDTYTSVRPTLYLPSITQSLPNHLATLIDMHNYLPPVPLPIDKSRLLVLESNGRRSHAKKSNKRKVHGSKISRNGTMRINWRMG